MLAPAFARARCVSCLHPRRSCALACSLCVGWHRVVLAFITMTSAYRCSTLQCDCTGHARARMRVHTDASIHIRARTHVHTHPLTHTHAQVLLFQRLRAILTAAAARRSSRVLTSAKASGRRPLARPTLFLSHPRETSLHRVRVGPLGIVPCRCSRPVLAGVACFRSHWTRVFVSARPPRFVA